MTFTVVQRHQGRKADPWHVSLSIRHKRMTGSDRTTLKAEIRLGFEVLKLLGVQVGGHVQLGIGRDGDAGRFELTPGTKDDRLVSDNHGSSARLDFPGALLSDEPWPCVRLEIIEFTRGRLVVSIPKTEGEP